MKQEKNGFMCKLFQNWILFQTIYRAIHYALTLYFMVFLLQVTCTYSYNNNNKLMHNYMQVTLSRTLILTLTI